MKKLLIMAIVLLLFLFSCKSKIAEKQVEKIAENNLLKQMILREGEVRLEIKKVLSFDLTKSKSDVLVVNGVLKGEDGYYFTNKKNVKIYKYDKDGKFIREFLKRGQGPGDLSYLMNVRLANNSVYALSMNKIIKFNKDGNFVFQKRFPNIHYYPIDIVDDNRVVGEKFNMSVLNGKKGELKMVELFDIKEGKATKLAGTEYSGQITLKIGSDYLSLTVPDLSPGIVWAYDTKNKRLYYANSDEYKITAVGMDGQKLFDFGRVYKPIRVDIDIINEKFGILKKNTLKDIKKNVPQYVMPIGTIEILSSGYIAVYNEFGKADKAAIDVFDSKGHYIYKLKLPEVLELNKLFFFNDGNIGYIKETPNGLVFTEYAVKKPEHIF